ncbi:tetratricopeptide repeat protein [Micromonospora sp. NPDC047134]|uniref:tetratricopeptide repeat protein n=1 Tax=Micromonospora sp. NPDC047134 TaxID=3154340 RepID=UPI003406B62B
MVPRLADCFQPRAAYSFDEGGGNASGTRLLSGLGGVGKTQMAIGLAEQLMTGNQLDLLVWVSAASRQSILAGYGHAAVDLLLPGADGSNTGQDAARFHAWLATTNRRWLVVLDDLCNAADLKGLWPPNCPTGRAVVTTRLRGSSVGAVDRRLIQVGVFVADEAAAYLTARLAEQPDLADDLEGVVADLGSHPLALAQASAFMIDEGLACSAYRQLFADKRQRLDDLVPAEHDLPDDYHRTIAATLALSIDAADRSRPLGMASPLLELASVLDSAGIPNSLFTSAAALNWLTFSRDVSERVDPDRVRSGLRTLHRLSVVTAGTDSVMVHALVQRVIRDGLTDERIEDLSWAAADALVEAWPQFEHAERDSALVNMLRAGAAAVRRHGSDSLLEPESHPLIFVSITSIGSSGNAAGAAEAFAQVLAEQERILGAEHPATFATRSNLAHWQGETGDVFGAITAYEGLLADQVRILGPSDEQTLSTRSNLAYLQGIAGDKAGAVDAFDRIWADHVRLFGAEAPKTLTARSNIQRFRGEAGDPAGAADAFARLHADRMRVLGRDHPHTLVARQSLANWRGHAGDAAGAVTELEQVLDDFRRVVGADHPDTLATRENLAYWRDKAGDRAGAAEASEQLLEDQLRVLGPRHPISLATRGRLATGRFSIGDFAGAAQAYEDLIADQVRALGEDHPETLTNKANLALILAIVSDDPIEALQRLLAEWIRVGAPDEQRTAVRGILSVARRIAREAPKGGAHFKDRLASALRSAHETRGGKM